MSTDDLDYAAVIEREGRRVAEAADTGEALAARVPTIPDWDLAALVQHVGEVYTLATAALRADSTERPRRRDGAFPDPPASRADTVSWYRDQHAALLNEIEAIDDADRPVYFFFPDHQRAGTWPRRVSHELTVHRVDAEQAAGLDQALIDPRFAVDGIDELLTVFMPLLGMNSPGDGRTVHLHATDVEGEWLLRFDEGSVHVERGHAKGDAAVRGPAADLYLWLWGRVPLDELEVFGDPDAARALRQVASV